MCCLCYVINKLNYTSGGEMNKRGERGKEKESFVQVCQYTWRCRILPGRARTWVPCGTGR